MAPDLQEMYSIENWVRIHRHEEQESEPRIDNDEALSLCDLATNEHEVPEQNHPEQRFSDEQEEDFAFGGDSSHSPENKMCSADELFFRGQILPLRHSVTLPSRFTTRTQEFTRSISCSRSEPVSVASSRSSSTRSSTSGSEINGYKPIIRNRNQFHSYPSPTPQIRTRSVRHSYPKSSLKWSFLQLGPMKLQEIGLADLRNRRERNHENEKEKHVLSFAGCKCSANVIESTVSSRMSMVKPTTLNEPETGSAGLRISKERNVERREHAVSDHRTSKWLKQLFIQRNGPL
ncbi:hypothetical protein R6Q59_003559 [Mikania micrantha]